MDFYLLKNIIGIFSSIGFFGFGIFSFIRAYSYKDPFIFLVFFFSSSFMILVSIAVFAGAVIRLKKKKNTENIK